ncbi:Retrovirus-related Pol polyprotein from transposon TNT 1-94 [Vitis vinifera]|uniref:Retrovirus-related Pol polyprotein from transposon TNT 1-94 n=1 Tax=Vitis vinifera TaxID=29760 RepID=A0A438GMC2_VITVI|nr:Retrovirus-related Pol polyprotein from transposon TNT 1-94 [Vitis vinifera]
MNIGGPFEQYCKIHDIKLKKTVPKIPQQNGVAERMNRTICDRIRCMLSHAKLPKSFWGEAMRTTVDPINMSPSYPLEAFVHVPRDEQSKLDNKTKQCIFLGYSNEEFRYRLWDPTTKKIIRSRDVVFFEDQTIEDLDRVKKPKPFSEEQVDLITARYKVRLVVKGFSQKKVIDFEEIFSPVVKMFSIRVVLGLADSMNLEIEQLDAPRQWYKKFDSFMVEHGYDKTASSHCVFVKKFFDGEFIILLLYMDDILIVGRDIGKIDKLKKELSKSFEMKDLGSARQILGIKISRNKTNGKLWLSQESYIEKVLGKFNMGKAKPMSSSLGSHLKLSSKQSPSSEKEKKEMRKVPYASTVGSLMYVMVCTRLDIAYVVGVVRCTNADMARDVDSRKSTFEVEYIVIIEASKELLWMKKFLQELGLQQERYLLYCDSQSVIHLSKNLTFHSRSKHIDLPNLRGDTLLHLEARKGYIDVVVALFDAVKAIFKEMESGIGTDKVMLRMTNMEEDTTFHEAVHIVELLIQKDLEFTYGANITGHTPLCIYMYNVP